MRIKEVNYKRNFLVNAETMEHKHIGVIVELNEGESAVEAYHFAENFIEEMIGDIQIVPLDKPQTIVDELENERLQKEWKERMLKKLNK